MELLFAMTLPALVLGLTALGVWELHRDRRSGRRHGTAMSTIGFDLVQEVFNPGKRTQVEQRDHEALTREDDAEGAPPRSRIDFDAGVAHIVLPRPDRPR